MKVDGNIGMDLRSVAKNAQEVEAAGYSGAWTAETSHDPFLPLLLAAEHTERLPRVGGGVEVGARRDHRRPFGGRELLPPGGDLLPRPFVVG